MKDRRLLKLLVLAGASVVSGSACVAENVALGRPYALSHPPNYPYCTDDGDATDLTDGARYNPRGTSLWTQKGTVGWALGEQLKTIEIDLGQICSVEGVTFETAADNRSQGTFPLAVLVFVSDDGQSYSFAGNIINEAVSQAAYVVHTFKLDGLKEQGRFVRLVTISGGFYVFVDEIEVLGSKTPRLAARERELTATSVLKFAQDRTPLTRQNNSSLALLAHARQQIETQPESKPRAQALNALMTLKSSILSRDQTASVDFRRGIPFTNLDREICRAVGRCLADFTDGGVIVTPASPWVPLMPFDQPEPVPQTLTLMKNEWGELAFNLTNATAESAELEISIDSASATAVSLFEVKFVEAFGFRIRADALMPLQGKLQIPPGMTKQVWLSIDSRKLPPRKHEGILAIAGDGVEKKQRFSFSVSPVEMRRPSLNVVNFSYMHWPITQADLTGVARDLREHYVVTQVVVSSYLPDPVAGPDGNIVKPMDFSKLDQYMDRLPETRLWIFFTGFEWDHRKMYPKPGEARRERLFKQWLTAMIAHLKKRGLGYENFAFLWHDEPSQKSVREIVAPSTAALRQVDPKAQVWIDVSADHTAETITAFAGVADIWCPSSEKLDWEFWKGKRTWYYDSASDKGKSPTGHYRYKLWLAFKHGATGNGFWTYTDSSHLWDDYAGSPTYSVVYDGPDGVISSKRWEAYRAGVEDYELCRMLRQAVAAAEKMGDATASKREAARKSLEEWTGKVLKHRDDVSVADQAHQELLRHVVVLTVE